LLSQLERELASRFGIDVVPGSPQSFVEHALEMLPPNTRGMTVTQPEVLREKLLEMVAKGEADPDGAAGLSTLGHQRYRSLVASFVHELRVFAACNCALFVITALLVLWRRQDVAPLVVPAGILAASTCVSVVLYVAAQSWFWSFLTGDYMGIWYLAVVGTVIAFLADIILNGGRVTSVVTRVLGHLRVAGE
jgi:hypothetical protein